MKDNSKEKAQDILDELVNQYNEDAISDKNFISKNTSILLRDNFETFINGQLQTRKFSSAD
jgi:hypothetical protein